MGIVKARSRKVVELVRQRSGVAVKDGGSVVVARGENGGKKNTRF